MRCARCGNENSEANRFCGMCGATLLPTPSTTQTVPAAGTTIAARPAAPALRPVPTASLRTAPAKEEASSPVSSPVISGPSFLGLNQPAPRTSTGERASADPNAAPSSRNLDYLLEDDEPPKRGGAGKFILILVALALAVGMGYLRWRNHGFGWLSPSASKPPAASQSADADSSSAPSGDNTSSTPAAPVGSAAQAAGDSSSASGSEAPAMPAAPRAVPAGSTTAPSSGAPDAAAGNQPSANPTSASPSTSAKDSGAASSADADATDQPKPADQAPKPAPAVKPAKPADVVTEAQKYLYGRGVAQNCDRGLRILKPAADHANPKAMIEMGALYSAGLCTPRDLPTAYRWFAQALRKEPENQEVQSDLQKLWGEMTQPERQLAIKLSQ